MLHNIFSKLMFSLSTQITLMFKIEIKAQIYEKNFLDAIVSLETPILFYLVNDVTHTMRYSADNFGCIHRHPDRHSGEKYASLYWIFPR